MILYLSNKVECIHLMCAIGPLGQANIFLQNFVRFRVTKLRATYFLANFLGIWTFAMHLIYIIKDRRVLLPADLR